MKRFKPEQLGLFRKGSHWDTENKGGMDGITWGRPRDGGNQDRNSNGKPEKQEPAAVESANRIVGQAWELHCAP